MDNKARFEIDLPEGRLWREGQQVNVKKKVFDLLQFFVENEDRLLTKQDILDAVWPDTYVSNASVKDCVKNLRHLLQEDSRKPLLIETVRGRGYRYLGGISVRSAPLFGASWSNNIDSFYQRPAVVVLPFENLSADPEQEYFSDGLSEDIITLLSAWRNFPVVARSSSFVFKGKNADARQVAKSLGARYVIDGSVRRSGTHTRVTAQLIDGCSGHIILVEQFDSPLANIFEVQDEITSSLVSSFEPQIEATERNRIKTKRASSLNAWDHYLRGRGFMHVIATETTDKARTQFEKAIEMAPEYADAYAALSHVYQRQIFFEVTADRTACGKTALKLAQRAVAFDNESSFAHLALGSAYIWLNEHDLSISETQTAVELNPSNTQALLALGNRLDIVGRSEEGIPLLEKSLRLHPRDPYSHIYFAQLARAYINMREYEKALHFLHESTRRNPNFPHAYHVLAICLGHLGRRDEARQAACQCEALHPGFMKKRAHWNIYMDQDANDHLTSGLRKAELLD